LISSFPKFTTPKKSQIIQVPRLFFALDGDNPKMALKTLYFQRDFHSKLAQILAQRVAKNNGPA